MSDNDLIRRGDALDCFMGEDRIGDAMDAIAALPAVQVGVKALEWEATDWWVGDGVKGENDCEWEASNAGGWLYQIEWMGAGDFRLTMHDHEVILTEGGLKAAKAAAQADYEARIRSALTVQPAPEVAALVEALRETRDIAHSLARSEYEGVWSAEDFETLTPRADAALAKLEAPAND